MKRILSILAVAVHFIIAFCQSNDTIWVDEFNGDLNADFWNYEEYGVTDLVLYRQGNVRHWGSEMYIDYFYNLIDGYRFGAGGINTENKISLKAGQSVIFKASMPDTSCELDDGIKFIMSLVNATDTLGYELVYNKYNTDYARYAILCRTYHDCSTTEGDAVISEPNVMDRHYHEYKISICDEYAKFYIDNAEVGMVQGNFSDKTYWIKTYIEVEELGQPVVYIDYGDPIWSNIDVIFYCSELYLDKIAIIDNHSCENIEDALSEVPADELLTIKGGVLTLKGVAEGTASAVFTPDGQRIMSFTGCKADISALPSGLYILRCGNRSAKFVK